MNAQEVLPTARSGSCSRLSRSVVRVAFWFFSYFSVSTDHSLHWMLANTLALFLTLFLLLPVCFTCYFLSVYASLLISLLLVLYSPSLALFCPSLSYFPPTLSLLLSLRGRVLMLKAGREPKSTWTAFSLTHTLQKWEGLCLCAANKRPVNTFRSACYSWWQRSRLCAEAADNIGVLILLWLHPVLETSEQTNQPR